MGRRGGSSGEREKSGVPWKYSFINVVIITIVLAILSGNVQCCGPGRGGGRRRSPRKLTPLVFKQHVPNLSENTLGASGISEGAITRDDPKFHDLVPNYNSDIIFKDEEGTGADRLMTEGCKEKLNTLAISVMNQWPGLKLRVTEGWDEEQHHAGNSLHYEGRAVDITTSDKDRAKYGMLARLAVEAGFDWVYYESRSHIHCSVKSERSAARKLGGCFPSVSTVETPSGTVAVSGLQEGDMVQIMQQDGSLKFSPVLMFLHKDANVYRRFLKIELSGGSIITITPSHLLWVVNHNSVHWGIPELSDALSLGVIELAGRVQTMDYLLVTNSTSGEVHLEKVVSVEAITSEGVFAPLTAEGTIVVDGVVASCYAVIDSQAIAHWSFLPVRIYYNLKEITLNMLRSIGVISPTRTKSEKYSDVNENLLSKEVIESNKNSVTKENNILKEITIKDFRKNRILHPKHKLYRISNMDQDSNLVQESSTSNDSSTSNLSNHIHWYPRLLYTMATWLLPSHLVYT